MQEEPSPPIDAPWGWAQRLYALYVVLVPTMALVGFKLTPARLTEPMMRLLAQGAPLGVVATSLCLGWVVYLGLAAELCKPPRQAWLALALTLDMPLVLTAAALVRGAFDGSVLLITGVVEVTSALLGLCVIIFTGNTRVPATRGAELPAALALMALFGGGAWSVCAATLGALWQLGDWQRAGLMVVALAWSTRAFARALRSPPELAQEPEVYILLGVVSPVIAGILLALARS